MAEVPHFDLPFRLDGHSIAVAEQDSNADIANCVEAIVRTRPGDRDELPAFGVSDLAFQQAPIDTDLLVDQIEEWEPRARAFAADEPERFDQTVRRVRVEVTNDEE